MVLLSLWRFYSVVFDNLLQESILMRIMWCIYSLVELSYIVWIEVIEFSEIVTFILVKSSLYRKTKIWYGKQKTTLSQKEEPNKIYKRNNNTIVCLIWLICWHFRFVWTIWIPSTRFFSIRGKILFATYCIKTQICQYRPQHMTMNIKEVWLISSEIYFKCVS